MATKDLNSTLTPATEDVLRRAGMRSVGVLRSGALVGAIPGPDGDLIACVGLGGREAAVHLPIGPWSAGPADPEFGRAAEVAERADCLAYPEDGLLWVIAWPAKDLPFEEGMWQAVHRLHAVARTIREVPSGAVEVATVAWCERRAALAGLAVDPDGGVLIPAESPSLLWRRGAAGSTLPEGVFGASDDDGAAAWILRTGSAILLARRSSGDVGAWWLDQIIEEMEVGATLQVVYLDRPAAAESHESEAQALPSGAARATGSVRPDPKNHPPGSADWAYATALRRGRRHPDGSVLVEAPGVPPIYCNRSGEIEARGVPPGAFGHSREGHVVFVARRRQRVTVQSTRGARDLYAQLFLSWLLDAGVARSEIRVSRIRPADGPRLTGPERLPLLDIVEDL